MKVLETMAVDCFARALTAYESSSQENELSTNNSLPAAQRRHDLAAKLRHPHEVGLFESYSSDPFKIGVHADPFVHRPRHHLFILFCAVSHLPISRSFSFSQISKPMSIRPIASAASASPSAAAWAAACRTRYCLAFRRIRLYCVLKGTSEHLKDERMSRTHS